MRPTQELQMEQLVPVSENWWVISEVVCCFQCLHRAFVQYEHEVLAAILNVVPLFRMVMEQGFS